MVPSSLKTVVCRKFYNPVWLLIIHILFLSAFVGLGISFASSDTSSIQTFETALPYAGEHATLGSIMASYDGKEVVEVGSTWDPTFYTVR